MYSTHYLGDNIICVAFTRCMYVLFKCAPQITILFSYKVSSEESDKC